MTKFITLFLCAVLIITPALAMAEETLPHPSVGRWLVHDLPNHIGNDLKYSFINPWNFIALGIGVSITSGVHEKDDAIVNHFNRHGPALGTTFDNITNVATSPYLLGGLALGAWGFSKALHHEDAAIASGTFLEAFLLTEAITLTLQYSTQREKPNNGGKDSFPSAHTSGAFALASTAATLYGPWVGIPSFAAAALVGYTRIDSNRHYASDVVAGALLGTFIGYGTAAFHKKRFPNTFVTPMISSGGGTGIGITHRF